ncbi:response regulator transcription factor [Acuticoccus sp. MNP-M23]|uniref:response regulator transcription factor n=1 Tax=Acuticoccus sp. MNP-M23 TaxID=3072793 RepID=UPI002814D602|nr:response regulator transcription factor [Acuticoccus sp. MNP-M23]WMS41900.1 response regulator transcription factor [Acuticoccus sp. MNP-M23]
MIAHLFIGCRGSYASRWRRIVMRVLLVEDASDVAATIAAHLTREGFACDVAERAREAETCLSVQSFDLVILDIQLADGDGRDVLRNMRQREDATPVLMLSANYSVETRIGSLYDGADDYLVKPFDLRELTARIWALSRRGRDQKGSELVLGDLALNPSAQTVRLRGELVAMTRRELTLLNVLLRNPGRILTKERLFDCLFTFNESDVGLNAVELYVARIRKKLGGSDVKILTHRNLGYSIEASRS